MLPDVEGRRLAENEWRRLGLPANWRRLKHNLTVARSRGLAEDNGDHTDGISALGFAFTDHVGDLHAISIPVPTPRFAEQKETVQAALLRVKAEILRIFGR